LEKASFELSLTADFKITSHLTSRPRYLAPKTTPMKNYDRPLNLPGGTRPIVFSAIFPVRPQDSGCESKEVYFPPQPWTSTMPLNRCKPTIIIHAVTSIFKVWPQFTKALLLHRPTYPSIHAPLWSYSITLTPLHSFLNYAPPTRILLTGMWINFTR